MEAVGALGCCGGASMLLTAALQATSDVTIGDALQSVLLRATARASRLLQRMQASLQCDRCHRDHVQFGLGPRTPPSLQAQETPANPVLNATANLCRNGATSAVRTQLPTVCTCRPAPPAAARCTWRRGTAPRPPRGQYASRCRGRWCASASWPESEAAPRAAATSSR